MSNRILITKASGEQVEFDPAKLRRSLHRAGAGKDRSEAILQAVRQQLRAGMHTKQIYQLAHRMLRKENRHNAARYSLKQALLALGPSGYPFELFIGRLLEDDGYRVETGTVRQGRCVLHEVDVFARADHRLIVGECKFHNRQNLICDVKIPLYIHSRFRDLQAGFLNTPEWANQTQEGWIFTNTRFTDDALQYGRCNGMHLISWDTPFDFSLRNWVDRTGLHPLTCLTTLTRREKEALLETAKIVMARDILTQPEVLDYAHIGSGRVRSILNEAEQLCAPIVTEPEGAG